MTLVKNNVGQTVDINLDAMIDLYKIVTDGSGNIYGVDANGDDAALVWASNDGDINDETSRRFAGSVADFIVNNLHKFS